MAGPSTRNWPNWREPERGERGDDGQRRGGDGRADARRRRCAAPFGVVALAQLLPEAEQEEEEVVDADADEHHIDQPRRAGVGVEPTRARRPTTSPLAAPPTTETASSGRRAARAPRKNSRLSRTMAPSSSSLRERAGSPRSPRVVRLGGDAAGEADAQAVGAGRLGGAVAHLAEALLGDRVGAVGLPLQADELEAPVRRLGRGAATIAPARSSRPTGSSLASIVPVRSPALQAVGEPATSLRSAAVSGAAVGALDERGDGGACPLRAERRLAELGRARRLGGGGRNYALSSVTTLAGFSFSLGADEPSGGSATSAQTS